MPLEPGSRLGLYFVTAKIGEGGPRGSSLQGVHEPQEVSSSIPAGPRRIPADATVQVQRREVLGSQSSGPDLCQAVYGLMSVLVP